MASPSVSARPRPTWPTFFDGSGWPVWPLSHQWLGLLLSNLRPAISSPTTSSSGTPSRRRRSTTGVVVTVRALRRVARDRLILRWRGPAPAIARRPALFWITAASIGVPGAAVLPALPAAFLAHTSGARLIAVAAGALLAATIVVRTAGPAPAP